MMKCGLTIRLMVCLGSFCCLLALWAAPAVWADDEGDCGGTDADTSQCPSSFDGSGKYIGCKNPGAACSCFGNPSLCADTVTKNACHCPP